MAPIAFSRRSAWLAVCTAATSAVLGLLLACGPGLGGTGTGPSVDPLVAFNASAAPVCNSDLAASLQCPAGTAGAPSAGTAAVGYAAGAGGTGVVARFEGDRIDVQWPCQGLRFTGQFGQSTGPVAAPPGRYFGLVEQNGAAPALASLSVQRLGDTLLVQLFDATGAALGEARVLTRLAMAPPVGAAVCS